MDIHMKYTVLFVDDEPLITYALKAIFRKNYEVLTANNGKDALEILEENNVDVIVSDQVMPKMLGSQLLAAVSQRYPQTMRILLTGFMDKNAIVDSINQGEIYRFINKPWDNNHIQEVVAEAAIASETPNIEYPVFKKPSNVSYQASDFVDSSFPENEERTILLIENEKDVRHQIHKFCNLESITIYETQNIENAVAAATSHKNIGVVIIELSENTIEMLQAINLLKRVRPELVTIALAEEHDAQTAVDLINRGQVYKYLAKPLNLTEFQETIQNAFSKHLFIRENIETIKRHKVEKTDSVVASLQGLFKRFVHE